MKLHKKKDFYSMLEENTFSKEVTEILSKEKYPLDYLYQMWLKCDDSFYSEKKDKIEEMISYKNKEINQEKGKKDYEYER